MTADPIAPEPPLELPWRRLHPLSPLLRGGLFLLVVAGIIVANLRDRVFEVFFPSDVIDAMGPNESDLIDYIVAERLVIWVLLGLLLVIGIIVGISWLAWRFSTFRITGEAVESRRGILFRQHRRAPLERIQSVNLQRSLLARIVGLTEVEVQTAGQGGKVSLQYLGHREAKLVREQILLAAAAAGAPATLAPDIDSTGDAQPAPTSTPAPVPATDSATEFAPAPAQPAQPGNPAELAPAVDFAGQVYGGTASVLDGRLRDLADFDIDPSARETGMLIKVPVTRLIASILLGSEMLAVVVIALAIVAASIWGSPMALAGFLPVGLVMVSLLISQFNRGFNFALSRAADGVRVGAGLTATMTETIPFGRVHAVEALQPIGWRPFGWWKVRITTAGHSVAQGGQNKLQNTVLPVGRIDDVLRVVETLLHEGDGREDRRAALSEALVGDGTGFVGAGRRAAWLLWFGTRRAGIRIEDAESTHASLRVRRGWFTRTLVIMPIQRAQSVQLGRPFAHHLLGLATLQAHTVLGPIRVQMRGVDLEQARVVFDRLAGTVVRVQSDESHWRRGTASPNVGEAGLE